VETPHERAHRIALERIRLAQETRATALDLRIPSLAALPPDLAGLTQLQSLNLSGCTQITELGGLAGLTQLQSLNLSGCQGFHFGPLEGLLPTLNTLRLCGCQAVDLPAEICGTREFEDVLPLVRAHYRDLRAGSSLDSEVKVFFLGNGGVGKSQLCRRLCGLPYDPAWPSTHGIQLSETGVELEELGTPVRLNLWDFGGQEVYHGSHALFLQGQAVFVLLWTPEREHQDPFEQGGLVMHNRPLPYWFDYVRTFAGSASPVLLIQSQCDTSTQPVAPVPLAVSAEDFPAVRIAQVSAKTGLRLDFVRASLKEAVRDCIARRPLLPIGAGRARVRARLRELLAGEQELPPSQRRYRWLEREEFERLCGEAGGISDTEALLDFLYHNGVVFYRRGLFAGRIVLDQNWALEAIYTLFDRKRTLPLLRRSDGRFSRADLESLAWSRYTREEQRVFLGMMESCGICFRERQLAEDEWEYIAPELLPEWSEAQESLLAGRLLEEPPAQEAEAVYGFLHEGVLRNFLSVIGRHAGQAAIYWKYGCWFYEKTTASRVLIESRWESETRTGPGAIRFRAWGERSRELIEPLVEELKRLPIGKPPAVQWKFELSAQFQGKRPRIEARIVVEPAGRPAPLDELRIAEAIQPAAGLPAVYLSYAWSEDSPEGRRRGETIDGLCTAVESLGWKVVRDRSAMRYGDLISGFMKTLTHADRIIVALSAKYLRSPWCMAELFGIYQRATADKDDFLRHVVPLTFGDAAFSNWRDRVEIAKYWQAEFEEMERNLHHLGASDLCLYKAMQDWHNRVGDMLAYLNDVLHPHGYEAIEENGFAGLTEMLGGRGAHA
jgi:internalin A